MNNLDNRSIHKNHPPGSEETDADTQLRAQKIQRKLEIVALNMRDKAVRLLDIVLDNDHVLQTLHLDLESLIHTVAQAMGISEDLISQFDLSTPEGVQAARQAFAQRDIKNLLVFRYPNFKDSGDDPGTQAHLSDVLDFYFTIQTWFFHTKGQTESTILQIHDQSLKGALNEATMIDTLLKVPLTPNVLIQETDI